MQISSKRELKIWPVSKTGKMSYRIAESLDRDIAIKMAAGYGKAVLTDATAAADFGIIEKSQADMLADLGNSQDDIQAFATHFYAVALAERLVSEIEGIDLDKQPMKMTRRDFSVLFRDDKIQSEWLLRATANLHKRIQAGNV